MMSDVMKAARRQIPWLVEKKMIRIPALELQTNEDVEAFFTEHRVSFVYYADRDTWEHWEP